VNGDGDGGWDDGKERGGSSGGKHGGGYDAAGAGAYAHAHAPHGHAPHGHAPHGHAPHAYTTPRQYETCAVTQQYETPLFPTGCIFKIIINSTHGDPFYVGLNGLELYDSLNRLVPLDETNIEAAPRDINVLPDARGDDPRTLDKLYDGVYNTFADNHMWLSPLVRQGGNNTIFVFFDEPVSLSRVTFWNYSKTPARGVRELEFFVDDVLVYRGVLKRARSHKELLESGELGRPSSSSSSPLNDSFGDGAVLWDDGQTILFTNDERVVREEGGRVFLDERGTVFIDEGEEVGAGAVGGGMERPSTAAVQKN